MIIPNIIEGKKDEKRIFYLRLFASDAIEIVEMPETLEVSSEGTWDDNAGGKRKIEIKKETKTIY